jgi:hypothetical protein
VYGLEHATRKDRIENTRRIITVLEAGLKTFSEIQTETGLSSRTVTKNLFSLEKAHYIKRIDKKYALDVKLSLIWDLLEFQDQMAWYVHKEFTAYGKYGLTADYARYPNVGSKFTSEAAEKLESAFMKGLGKVIRSKDIALEPREGKFLATFEVDWAKFSQKMKKTDGVIKPDKPSKKDLQISRVTSRLKKGEVLDADTGEVLDKSLLEKKVRKVL